VSTPALTKLEQLPADVWSRVMNDPFLATVNVMEERKGVTDADVANTLGTVTKRSTKKGAVIIVGDVAFNVQHPDAPGPQINPYFFIHCIERVLVNRAPSTGTMITAEAMALRITQLCHNFQSQNLGVTLTAKAGEVFSVKEGEREMAVRIETIMQLQPLAGCGFPNVSGTVEAVVIASPTVGSTVYYTLDGSAPGPENAAAAVYQNPFAVQPPTLVRAVAFNPPTLVPSNIASKQFN
jgi:hypothetical protein